MQAYAPNISVVTSRKIRASTQRALTNIILDVI